MKKNSIVLVAILVITALLAGCGGGNIPIPPTTTTPATTTTPTTSFRVPIFPNDSNVVAKVVAVRRLTEKSSWEIDIEILHSYDVPGFSNIYKTKIGQVVTVLTLNDVTQLKGQVINARIQARGDERGSGTYLDLLTPFPQRIVSLGPKITEILVALGASEKIIGIDDFSQWPSTRAPIPRLGEPWPPGDVISPKQGRIDTNAIVALHPDLVIVDRTDFVKSVRDSKGVSHWSSATLNLELQKAGIPLRYLYPVELYPRAGVTEALNQILSVGAIVGESDKAEQLVASYEKRKQAVVDRVQNLPKVRVVLVWGYGGPPAPGSLQTEDYPLNELVQLAGGVNVFTSSQDDRNMVQESSVKVPFTVEPLIIAKNPEVILVIGGLDQWQLDRPGWEKVEAVQKGRVYAIGEITPLTGIDRLEEIARLLHPT